MMPSFQRCGQPAQNIQKVFSRSVGRVLEEILHPILVFGQFLPNPAGDIFAHRRNSALLSQANRVTRVIGNDRLNPIPQHQWQIVVGCVFSVPHQRGGERLA